MTRLIQLKRGDARRVALVEEPHLRLLDGCGSIYELANSAIAGGVKLSDARAAAEPLTTCSNMTRSTTDNPSGASCRPSTIPRSRRAAWFLEPD